MSFLSVLGKIGAGIAAPFTGGLSALAIPAIDAIGAATSGAAKGSADQRLRENQGQLSQQQLALLGSRDQFLGDQQSAQFQQSEQDRQRKAAMLSALLKGTQDQTITPGNPAIAARMPQVQGGMRPSNLTGNADILMQLLGQAPIQAPQYQAPPPFKLDEAGLAEKIFGGVGLGSSLLGAVGRFNKPKTVMTEQEIH